MKGDPVIEGQVAESISTETINLLDSDNSNLLSVKWNEDDSLDRTLNLMLSGANRDLTLSGNVALNQSLLTTSSPTFNNLTLTNPTFAMFGLSAPVDSSIPQWDVVNSVWTWSTGIADLSGFTTDDLDEGTNNKYFPGFTSLSTDYNFTDNSSNWNTAYGWGDHADANYLSAASTGITANSWTINSTQANVTSTLTFGRTTGGDATISWDGSSLFIGKMTTIARLGANGVGIAGVFTLQTDAKTVGDGIAYQYIASTDGDINRIYGYLGMKLTAVTSGAWSGDFVWHPTHLGVTIERMRLTSLGSLILNSSKNDVTSTLTFGRTTGGDATISWDGVSQKFNNQIEVTGSNNFYNIVAKGPSPDSTGALCGIAFSALNLSNRIKAAIGTVWEGTSWGRQDLVFAVRSTADNTNVTLADEKMRIAYDGTVTTTNNLYVGGNVSAESFTARSGQITFPATQVPSANANTLDDYREGTFVPTVYCSGGGGYTLDPSYDTLSYVKIGSLITVTGHLIITDKDSVSGWVRITIPFACASLGGATYSSGVVRLTGLASGNGIGAASIVGGSRYIGLYKPDGIELTKAEAGYSFSVNISLTFRAAN